MFKNNSRFLFEVARKSRVFLFVAATLTSLLIPALGQPEPAKAQSIQDILDITWLNTNTIQVKVTSDSASPSGQPWFKIKNWEGQYFLRTNMCGKPSVTLEEVCFTKQDNKWVYSMNGFPNECPGHNNVTFRKPPDNDAVLSGGTSRILADNPGDTTLDLKFRFYDDAKDTCLILDATAPAKQSESGGGQVYGEWIASNAIKVYETGKNYIQTTSDPNLFLEQDGDEKCPDAVKVTGPASNGETLATFYDQKEGEGSPIRGDCGLERELKNVIIAKTAENKNKEAVDPGTLTPADSGASDDGQSTCDASGLSIAWIVCPIFNGVAELTDWLYRTLIEPFLVSPPVNTDPNSESFRVWSSFRVVGNIILAIGLLVIVFGQSLGGGMIDAYTAKKVFPRIIAAAILTNLSIYLVAVAVDISNIVGSGLPQLMFAPFKATGMANFELSGTQQAVGAAPLAFMGTMIGFFVASGASAIGGAGFMAALGAAVGPAFSLILLSVILPAALILLAIFVVLALRRALIVFLIMIAPIAFALYVLPNTEKYFKKWWEFLVKALLVYPIVAVMFALADIMAITMLTASNSNNSNFAENGTAVLVAFGLQLIPLAAIPFSFKLAGGILGNLYGTFSGMGKKGTELIKGNAQDPLSKRNQARKNFRNKFTDVQTAIQGANENVPKRKRNALQRGLRNIASGGSAAWIRQAQNAQEAAKNLEVLGNFGNDNMFKAGTLSANSLGRLRGTSRHRVDSDGNEFFRAADGTWVSEAQVQHANSFLKTHQDRVKAFQYTLSKAENLTDEDQQAVFEDYVAYANDSRISKGDAAGGWAGISIPNKAFSQHLRRTGISGDPGSFTSGGVNGHQLNTDFANMKPHEMVGQTGGAFDALQQSISDQISWQPDQKFVESVNNDPAKIAEEQRRRQDKAFEAYDNLKRYVTGAGEATVGAPGAGGGAAPGAVPSYSASGSAAAKNAEAARNALMDTYTNLRNAGQIGADAAIDNMIANRASDRRLKKNIRFISTSTNGIKLYEFSYLWSDKRYIGVMAQDLLESHPEAVTTDANGYYAVDYSKLGLRMISAEDYANDAYAIYLEVANRA